MFLGKQENLVFVSVFILALLMVFCSAFAATWIYDISDGEEYAIPINPVLDPKLPIKQLDITSPTNLRPMIREEGSSVPFTFYYNYWCPSGYAVEIYRDSDPQDLVCSKTVLGLGWVRSYTYSGLVCEFEANSKTIQDVCGLSNSAEDGRYTVKIILFDFEGGIAKTDYEVSALTIRTNKPDLLVSDLALGETSILIGEPIGIEAVVYNNGLKDSDSFNVSAYYVDSKGNETLFETKEISSLVLGSNDLVDFSLDTSVLETGSYSVKILADPLSLLGESNELNNDALSDGFSVFSASAGQPDIFIDGFSSDVNSVSPGDTIDLNVTFAVKESSVDRTFYLSIYQNSVEESPLESRLIQPMALGESRMEEFSIELVPFPVGQELSIIAFVDSDNVVPEILESNNKETLVFELIGGELVEVCYNNEDDDFDGLVDEECQPDLFVEGISYLFDVIGQAISPNSEGVFVFNGTPSQIRVPVGVGLELGEDKNLMGIFPQTTLMVELVNPLGNYTFRTTYGLQEGTDYSSAENATTFTEFLDLVGGLLDYSLLIDGQPVNIPANYYSVLHDGIDWHGSEESGFVFNLSDLSADGTDFAIRLHVDLPSNEFGQSLDGKTSNNSFEIPVKFVKLEECNGEDDDGDGLVDEDCALSVSSLLLAGNPEFVPLDCPMKVMAEITNEGLIATPELTVSLFRDFPGTGELLKEKIISPLQPGETREISFYGIPTYFLSKDLVNLYLFVDSKHSFSERDELNNYEPLLVNLFVEEPNLSVELITIPEKTIVAPGTKITIDAIVKNQGFQDVENVEFVVASQESDVPFFERINSIDIPGGADIIKEQLIPALSSRLIGEEHQCKKPFAVEASAPSKWTNSRRSSPASYGKNDPNAFLQLVELYDFDEESQYFVSSIYFVDSYGSCDLEISKYVFNPPRIETVGYFSVPLCMELIEGGSALVSAPLYSEFIGNELESEHMFDVVGWIKADFSKLRTILDIYGNSYWEVGMRSDYSVCDLYPRLCGRGKIDKGLVPVVSEEKIFPSPIKEEIKILLEGELDSNTEEDVSFEFDTTGLSGRIVLTICIDPEDQIEELNELDNCSEVEVIVSDKPNLKFVEVSSGWIENEAGEKEFEIEMQIENDGISSAENFGVSIYRFVEEEVLLEGREGEGEVFFSEPELSVKSLESITALSLEEDEVITITKRIPQDKVFNSSISLSQQFPVMGGENVILFGSEEGDESIYLLLDPENEVDEAEEEDNQVLVDPGSAPSNEICGDNVDNDLDGLVDEGCVELCGNSLDDDGDGQVDEGCAEVCGDGIDNDLDGLVDEGCNPYLEEICGDNLDNDLDGKVDEGCKQEFVEICGNNIDDDFDGQVDEGCVTESLEGMTEEEKDAIRSQYVFSAAVDPIVLGKTQIILFSHLSLGPVQGQAIRVIPPKGNAFELETDLEGRVEFKVEELGGYFIETRVKSVRFEERFESTLKRAVSFSSIEEAMTFFFGVTVKENLFFIPLLLLMALTAAFLVYNRAGTLFGERVKSSNRVMMESLVRFIAALVFFFAPLLVNRFVSFNYAIIAVVLELVIIFLASHFARRAGKQEKQEKFKFKLSI